MKTIHTEKHRLRNSKSELSGGLLVSPYECPERVDYILARLKQQSLGEIISPNAFGLAPILRIHDEHYLEFLSTCWTRWKALGYQGEAIASVWPARGMRQRKPTDIEGLVGYYAFASETTISDGTWEAALHSADVALSAQALIASGEKSAFALCRPPGHHAASDLFGGYCFINNAAVAAQASLDQGAKRVVILDVDFHHGNGTQEIFYHRNDVFYVSLHGHPAEHFPHFLGYADEKGTGEGEGFNLNLPMSSGTDFDTWDASLALACNRIMQYAPDILIVSLGVDTFVDDPISNFRLQSDDFTRYGERLGKLGIPTLFVMEGGYAVSEIGTNVVNVLAGFEGN
jgi:acetoin utilization deacetylase AcuC-like enzyme